MSEKITDKFLKDTVKLAAMMMAFGKVYRATYLDADGTRESDTDHTTMLAVIACSVAHSLKLDLDLGKVAQYALVHDLVEVYAGDVNTIDLHNIDHEAKQKNEAEALKKIKDSFGESFPWIIENIENYERLLDKESRFVKTIDKIMPALTHLHTENRAVNEGFDDPEAFEESVIARNEHMRKTFAFDQEVIMELRELLLEPTIAKKYKHHRQKRVKK